MIGESLRRATSLPEPSAGQLRDAIDVTLAASSRDYETLTADPLAGWIETTFGLTTEARTNRLVRQRPVTVPAAAERLAETSGLPAERCQAAIQAILQEGARVTDPMTGRPLFAFRLHQFLSKGDTLYVSLEPEAERHITSQKQVSVPGHRDRTLLPLAFCRECGQEYLVVARVTRNEGSSYAARPAKDCAPHTCRRRSDSACAAGCPPSRLAAGTSPS